MRKQAKYLQNSDEGASSDSDGFNEDLTEFNDS